MSTPRPSWSFGFRTAVELWRVVAAVFVVSVVVFVPAHVVLWTAGGETLAQLPDRDLPAGESTLIAFEVVGPVWPALATAAVSGWSALWLWTVLWHAGVVRWLVFSGRRGVRLAEILSRGLLHWWRWARLALTSVALIGLGHAWIVVGYGFLVDRAARTGAEVMLGVSLVGAVMLAVVVVLVCWLAGLRGAWLLGDSGRRSSVMAWFGGLVGTFTQPVSSVVTLALWAVPAVIAAIFPLVAAWQIEMLRAPIANSFLTGVAGLVQAFCWVGLFLSFAPASGLIGESPPHTKPADTAKSDAIERTANS